MIKICCIALGKMSSASRFGSDPSNVRHCYCKIDSARDFIIFTDTPPFLASNFSLIKTSSFMECLCTSSQLLNTLLYVISNKSHKNFQIYSMSFQHILVFKTALLCLHKHPRLKSLESNISIFQTRRENTEYHTTRILQFTNCGVILIVI